MDLKLYDSELKDELVDKLYGSAGERRVRCKDWI